MSIKEQRQVKHYSESKSDPICKWRIASINTVIELVSKLPKQKMPRKKFRDLMSDVYGGSFLRTAYQLASQLALYYEDNETYYPRFDHDIDEHEANCYMRKWMEKYYVPNPYTVRGFSNVYPSIILLQGLANYLYEFPSKPNLQTACFSLFGGEIGNIGNVKYVLNNYSNLIKVDQNNDMVLTSNTLGTVDVFNSREDKKAFFEHFN